MVVGRSKNNKIINIAGNSTLIGEILNIKVTELDNKTLKGEILNI
jgi:tRNA A37 methylthiotransferase MiaB